MQPLYDSYAGRGTPPHRPDLLVKLILFETRLGKNRPVDWHRDLRENEAVQWLVRGLRVCLATLYEFRRRLQPFLDDWNSALLRGAIDEGLTTATQGAIDGTTVAANASRHRLSTLASTQKRIEQLEASLSPVAEPTADPEKDGPAAASPSAAQSPAQPGWMARTVSGRQQQLDRYRKGKQRLETMQKSNDRRRSDKRKTADRIRISLGDPDAVLGQDKLKTYRPLYNLQMVLDITSDLILAYDVSATIGDCEHLLPMLDRTEEMTGVSLTTALGDAGYISGDNLAGCQQREVRLCGPWQENSYTEQKRRQQTDDKPPLLSRDEFPWDPSAQHYRCPEDNLLPLWKKTSKQKANGTKQELEIYRADPADCSACARKSACTTTSARTVRRQVHADLIDAHRQWMGTPEAKELYSKRSITVERAFADIKTHRGLERFSGRGLPNARAETATVVLANNLCTLERIRTTATNPEKQGQLAA